MQRSYSKIDPDDIESVLWLQVALARVFGGPASFAHVGEMSPPTMKALRLYQGARGLPVTGEPDEATLAQIRQELEQRGLTIP